MNTEDIFIGDLIQEANVSLVQALGAAGEILRSEEWLLEQIVRESVRPARSRARENLRMTVWWPGGEAGKRCERAF